DSDGWDAPIDDLPVQSKDPLPQLSGVLLDLQNARFAIVSAGDSVVFGPSSGSVALDEGIFVGQGGRIDGKSAGDSLIYAEFSDYAFQISSPSIPADRAKIYDKRLAEPILSALEYKSVRKPRGKDSSGFPRFISYHYDAVLVNFNENISYKG